MSMLAFGGRTLVGSRARRWSEVVHGIMNVCLGVALEEVQLSTSCLCWPSCDADAVSPQSWRTASQQHRAAALERNELSLVPCAPSSSLRFPLSQQLHRRGDHV